MATAISHLVLSRLFEEAAPAPRIGRRVVVACVQGERHEFPARLVADYLDLGGFDVTFLGADVPTDDLMRLLRAHLPDLLALSVTMSFNAPALRATVERVREEMPTMPILVGGHALSWEPALAARAGVASCGPEASSVVETARGLVERRAS
jgi:MerR family transcriptional regulator, light-induced transcriptional regulator